MNHEQLAIDLLKTCPRRDAEKEAAIFKAHTGAKLYLEVLKHIQQVEKKDNELQDLKFRKSIMDLTGYDPLKVEPIDIEEII